MCLFEVLLVSKGEGATLFPCEGSVVKNFDLLIERNTWAGVKDTFGLFDNLSSLSDQSVVFFFRFRVLFKAILAPVLAVFWLPVGCVLAEFSHLLAELLPFGLLLFFSAFLHD